MFHVTTVIPNHLNLTQYIRVYKYRTISLVVLQDSCYKYQLLYSTDCQNQSARDARYLNLKKTMSLNTVHESSSRKGGGRRGKC